jgi:hypothetical protein
MLVRSEHCLASLTSPLLWAKLLRSIGLFRQGGQLDGG